MLEHLADHKLPILFQQRIGLVIGKGTIGRQEVLVCSDRQLLEDRAEHLPGHPAATVQHDAEWSQRRNVNQSQHLVGVGRQHIERCGDTWRGNGGQFGWSCGQFLDFVETRGAPHRLGLGAHDLHAVVLGWVVRGSHDDAAIKATVGDGEVEHLGADLAQHGDICASVGSATNGCLGERWRGKSHVVPNRDVLRLKDLDVGAGYTIRAVGVELVRNDATDVIGLEDCGIERHA